MAQETSNLILRVDSTSVKPAATALDDLTKAAGRAEQASDSLAQATAEANQRYKDIGRAAIDRQNALNAEVRAQYENATSTKRVTTEMQAQTRAYTQQASAENRARQAAEANAAAMAKAAQAAAAERAELSSLLGAIDPVTRALDKLDQQQAQLRRAQARGLIDADTFNTYNAKLNETRTALGRFDGDLKRTGMTAKQSAQAMRMLPAQLTDITVGLLTGQPPLMVFLQQGGQLKDMFGGMVPALRAVSGAILGLVNPFTLAAAAAAALGLAFYQGSNEAPKFNAALAQTGNFAGRTAQELGDLSKVVGDSLPSTTGRAAAALTQLVATGRIAGSSLESVATAVVNMNEASGAAIDTMVRDFTRLADEPTRAIAELNKSMHFLDLATYERIRALEQQGQKEQAAALAQSTYAQAVNTAADRVRASAGTLERGWNTLGLAARQAWDYMLNIGRPTPTEELRKQAATLRATLEDLNNNQGFVTTAGGAAVGGGGNQAAKARLKAATDLAAIEQELLRREKEGAQARSAALIAEEAQRQQQASDRMEQLRKETRTRKEIRDAEIAQVRRDGETLRWTQDQINKAIANVEEKYKDPKGTSGSGSRVTEAQRLLEAARQQGAVLEQQADSAQKITSARATLIKFEQLITDLKDGRQLSADQKSVLLAQDALRTQYEKNAALEDENRARQASLRLTAAQQAADQALANDRARYSDQLVGMGGSSRDRERMQAQQQLVRENQRAMEQAERDFRLGRTDESEYNAQTAILRNSLAERLEAQRQYYADLSAIEGNWVVGARSALAEYALAAQDAAGMAKGFFTNAFQGLETVLTDFITTGKASFKDFVSSLLAESARLIARQGIIAPLLGLVGSFLPALGPSAPAAGSGVTMPTGGIRLPGRARGGPVRAGSMYEVNENGPELLSSGGRTFLMMGADGGHVTPSVAGAAGAGGANINVQIVNKFDGGGSVATETSGTGQNALVDQLSTMIDQQMRTLLQKETYQQGGIIWNLTHGNARR